MSQSNSDKPRPPIQAELVDDSGKPNASTLMMYIAVAILCTIYIFNPTAGLLEFIPDNLPIVGNLDEATATAGLLYALSGLGLIPWTRKK